MRLESTSRLARSTTQDRAKERFGGSSVRISRTERIRALKRSPHVFSKSQESFGVRWYGCDRVYFVADQSRLEVSETVAILSHIVPEVRVAYWKATRGNR